MIIQNRLKEYKNMLVKKDNWIDVYFKPCDGARLAHQVLRGYLDKENMRFFTIYSDNPSFYWEEKDVLEYTVI